MFNDFPILSNEEYSLIQNYYNANKPKRKILIDKIIFLLHKNLFLCYNYTPNNKTIHTFSKPAINKAKFEFQKILDNTVSLFGNSTHSNVVFKNNDYFEIIKNTAEIIYTFQEWSLTEEKEYYKNFSLTCQKDLTLALIDLLNNV